MTHINPIGPLRNHQILVEPTLAFNFSALHSYKQLSAVTLERIDTLRHTIFELFV
jgi:hypothetical protein